MKCISLWQPWASLVAIGAKQYETRHWTTRYRGLIAIHAAKKRDFEVLDAWKQRPVFDTLREAGYPVFSSLPRGCVVAIADLTAIYRAEELYPKIGDLEQFFGNYAPGRFAWRLENVRKLENPIELKGMQGLFDWTPPVNIDQFFRKPTS